MGDHRPSTASAVPRAHTVPAWLEPIVLAEGPFVSVSLDSTSATDHPGELLERRWRQIRRRLEQGGAHADLLDAVDDAVAVGHAPGDELVVIAGATGVLHTARHPEPPAEDTFLHGPVPCVVPLLRRVQSRPLHAVVLADRTGADVIVRPPRGDEHAVSVDGELEHITRSAPGGWSQRRFQQRAEDTWAANARQVAHRIERLFDAVELRVVVLAGDVRAVQLVRSTLPPRVLDVAVTVRGDRSMQSPLTNIRGAVDAVLDRVDAEDTAWLVEAVGSAAPHRRGVFGAGGTLGALAEGRVETLLVHHGAHEQRTAWCGPLPHQVGHTREAVRRLGVEDPQAVPLADGAIRAAVACGAAMRLVPEASVAGDVAALLRH